MGPGIEPNGQPALPDALDVRHQVPDDEVITGVCDVMDHVLKLATSTPRLARGPTSTSIFSQSTGSFLDSDIPSASSWSAAQVRGNHRPACVPQQKLFLQRTLSLAVPK